MTKEKTAPQQTEQQDLVVARERVGAMQAMVESFKVTTDEELAVVADKIKSIKQLAKGIKDFKDKFVAPAKAIIDQAKGTWDPLIKECDNQEIVLKERAKRYMLDKEEKRRAEEAKIAARVEKGTMKPETAMRKMEALPEASKTVRTDNGSGLRMSKRKVAKIQDPSLVPDEFWVIDEVRVRREALEREKYGKDTIPGVIVVEENDLASL